MSYLDPVAPDAWNKRTARHLLNRAGFGVPYARVDALAAQTPEAAVASLVDYHAHPEQSARPEFVLDPVSNGEIRKANEGKSFEEIQKAIGEQRRAEREAVEALRAWWLDRMRFTPNPLEEKMALFWHGHFAASAQKVQQSAAMYQLNNLCRAHATGNFKALTIAVSQSPAMLRYLDNARSTKEKPNENWARELMELFTLGVGNYTEADIKNSARAFTGWTAQGLKFNYAMRNHDTGSKEFLGRTGAFDGWDIINIIFEQPAASAFISKKLWEFFAYENPEPGIVAGLAETLRANNYELRPMLTQLFSSQAFYSDRAVGTQVKSPSQLLVQLCEDLDVKRVPPAFAGRVGRDLGQNLFYPPNVKGWDGNRAWINANSLLLRYNLPGELVAASLNLQQRQSQKKKAMDNPAMADDEAMAMEEKMMPEEPAMNAMAEEAPAMERETYQETVRKEFRAKMAALPVEERKKEMAIFRKATPMEKSALMEKYGIAPPPWTQGDPARLFGEFEFKTAGECVDALARRFLVLPLHADQRKVLVQALGAPEESAALQADDVDYAKRRAAVHLITSMAEYQLC